VALHTAHFGVAEKRKRGGFVPLKPRFLVAQKIKGRRFASGLARNPPFLRCKKAVLGSAIRATLYRRAKRGARIVQGGAYCSLTSK